MAEPVNSGRALWGGHFDTDPAPLMAQINASIGFDKRLAAHDLAGSRAHARMLAATAVITTAERDAILGGLDHIEAAITAGTFEFKAALEDIHFKIVFFKAFFYRLYINQRGVLYGNFYHIKTHHGYFWKQRFY